MGNRISPRRHRGGKSSVHPSYVTVPDFPAIDDEDDTLIATRSMTTPRPTEPMAIVSQRCNSDTHVSPGSRFRTPTPSSLTSVVDTPSLGMSIPTAAPPIPYDVPCIDRKRRAIARQRIKDRLTPESQQSPFWKFSLADSQTQVY